MVDRRVPVAGVDFGTDDLVFFKPAAQAVLPALVRERDLVAANSGVWTAAVVSQIVLAPLAGLVIAGFGFSWAFWINAVSYVASASVLRRLSIRRNGR